MIAYLLVNMPLKHCDHLLQDLQEIPEVKEIAALYGEMDLLVKIEAADNRRLDDVMIGIIRHYKEIEYTRTFIAVESYFWQRPSPENGGAEPADDAPASAREPGAP